MHTPLPSPWATTQTDLLSPEAVRALTAKGVLRDPARAAAAEGGSPDALDDDDLRALLREKGLPVFESVLDLERRCGGVLWGKDTFGAGVALRSGFDLRTLAGLVGSDLRDELGEDVVPVSFRSDLPRALFWMNEAGRLYLSHEADTFPAAESLACFWEREALKADDRLGCELRLHWSALPTGTDSDFLRFEARSDDDSDDDNDDDSDGDEGDGDGAKPTFRRYEDDPQRVIDERLAGALGLPLFASATDVWRRVWFDGDRLLYPHHPWQPAERLVRARDMGALARMAAAIAEVRPTALVIYEGPVGAPPAPGEPVIARLPAGEDASAATSELLFVGMGDTCRAHLVRRAEPWTVHDAWRARESAFRSRGE